MFSIRPGKARSRAEGIFFMYPARAINSIFREESSCYSAVENAVLFSNDAEEMINVSIPAISARAKTPASLLFVTQRMTSISDCPFFWESTIAWKLDPPPEAKTAIRMTVREVKSKLNDA